MSRTPKAPVRPSFDPEARLGLQAPPGLPLSPCSRRGFLHGLLIAVAGCARPALHHVAVDQDGAPEGILMTVLGPVPADSLGRALTHEHVVTDFIGAEKVPGPRYDPDLAFHTVLPHLQRLRQSGVTALFECTPQYIGRDVHLLQRLASASGLHIVTNTGYYGAVGNRYLPRHAFEESADALSARWLREWVQGIEGTGIRPGFVKLGTDRGPLPPVHEKLLRAAARLHQRTGLTICGHTGDGAAAFDQLRILSTEGVAPEAFVWVHAQNGSDAERIEAVRLGAWISLDGFSLGKGVPDRYLQALLSLRSAGCWSRVLVSQDDGWAVEGNSPNGAPLTLFDNGNPRPYASVFERLIPDLRAAGISETELDQLLCVNPARAFALRVRTTEAAG